MSTYMDYRFKFPITGLAKALEAMAELRTAGLLGKGNLPQNMLGDLRDTSGNAVSANAAWAGRPGRAAYTYTDTYTNKQISVPAAGDPGYYYIHIRAEGVSSLPFDPSAYGLVASDPTESAAVLGVWA